MTDNPLCPRQGIPTHHAPIDDLQLFSRAFREKNRYRRIPLRKIGAFCILFRRSLIEIIGLLDENFKTEDFAIDDLSVRTSLEGYQNLIAGDVFIHHSGSRGVAGNTTADRSSMRGDKNIFSDTWRNISATTQLGKKIAVYNALDRAAEYIDRHELDKAIPELMKGLEHDFQATVIHYFLVENLINAKLFKDALEALNFLPEEARKETRGITLTGYCKDGLELEDEAKALADRALLLDPGYAPAINLQGIVAYKKNDYQDAQILFQRAIEADPGYGEPYTNLGVLKWSMNEQTTGLDLLEKGFILSPTVPDIATLYQNAFTSLGAFDRAQDILREAKAVQPLNKGIAYMLIDLLAQSGDHDKTILEMEQAILSFGIEEQLLKLGLDLRSRMGALNIDPAKKDTVALSLCMIVKNEERHLPQCLMSVAPIVDEMIIVDTGSSDRTKDIATLFGANVYDFTWTGDFSAARNYSLLKATGRTDTRPRCR